MRLIGNIDETSPNRKHLKYFDEDAEKRLVFNYISVGTINKDV